MNTNWLDFEIENSISDYEFTKAAVMHMNRIITAEEFEEMDAAMIFRYLSNEMRIVMFNDYLKRYIYEKLEMDEPFETVPDTLYREVIISSFRDNGVPFSFTNPKEKGSKVVKRWLEVKTIKRESIFLLGFGLRMTDKDVSEFLTKVLQEHDFDLFNTREAVYWYCFRHNLGYARAMAFLREEAAEQPTVSWETVKNNPRMYLLTDNQLVGWLSMLKENRVEEERFNKRYIVFQNLYERVRYIIARIYQDYEEETRSSKVWRPDKITPADVEKTLCTGIPKNKGGNLQKMSLSVLSEQFKNKRMDRQRLSRLIAGKEPVARFDLITLLFLIYAEEIEAEYPEERYLQYISEINDILKNCDMMGIYPVNPYESFILMCLVTEGPLDVYSEVFEQSFQQQ